MANLIGTSWGNTPATLGDAGGLVTWSIASGGQGTGIFPSGPGTSVNPDSFMSIDYNSIINDAFQEWSQYGNIEFLQIEDGGGAAGTSYDADIRIFFGEVPGATLGYTFFPSSSPNAGAGDMILENLDRYNSEPGLLHRLALHEIGHALGLDHVSQGANSVMTPSLSQNHLQPDDINGIREIYGAQDNAPPVYALDAGQTNLNILNSPDGLIVRGNGLNNRIDGADQSETFNGNGGFDTIFAGNGNDRLFGQSHADELHGGLGSDLLDGGQGFDLLYGDAGQDTLRAGDDADRLYGGTGDDMLYGGSNVGGPVDRLFGEAGDDSLYGQAGYDLLDGGDGNDLLDGGHQADNLYGGAGNDTLRGSFGLDRLFGGDGNDFARGGDGRDGLFGERGDDTLHGEDGNDRFFGGSGDDLIYGGAGSDTVYGGAGFDTIDSGAGNDFLQGNFNADRFVFADGHGNDVITDFDANNDAEQIDLRDVSSITNLFDLVAHNNMSQVGVNVVIDTGGGNSITLNRVNIDDLDANDFIF